MSPNLGALFVERIMASAADLEAMHSMMYAHRINERLSEKRGPVAELEPVKLLKSTVMYAHMSKLIYNCNTVR